MKFVGVRAGMRGYRRDRGRRNAACRVRGEMVVDAISGIRIGGMWSVQEVGVEMRTSSDQRYRAVMIVDGGHQIGRS